MTRRMDLVEAFFPPGLRDLAIAEWMGDDGQIVNGQVDDAAEVAIEGLIDHIEESDTWDPRGDYGKINFIHTAYRYRLTPKAVRLYQRSRTTAFPCRIHPPSDYFDFKLSSLD